MAAPRLITPFCLVATLFLPQLQVSHASAVEPAPPTEVEKNRLAALEAAINGATLVGRFTITGKEPSEPRSERYELRSVKHIDDDQWLFQARIKYGEHDVTLPITLPIKWAGDTPVITVDEIAFPGLGTYTARVMIYQDHYAGFWSGANHGGHLFGVVERQPADATE